MAVTIDAAGLVAALRLGDSAEELAEVTRLLAYATEAVEKHAPTATDVAHNEAVRRIVGYLHDQPEASMGDAYANALRASGAARILLPYRIHRAGYVGAVASAQQAVGTVGNPVVDVSVNGAELVVTFADGTTETHDLPAGGMGGVDQTERDAAAAAQATADAAQGEIDAHETSEHNTDSTARGAAAQTQTELDTHEASTHNTDSVARSTAVNAQAFAQDHAASTHNTDGTARAAAAAAQSELDDHEASTHNTDTAARDAAQAAQGAANAAQTTADGKIDADAANALIAAHTRRHDAHHTPPHVGEGGGIVHVLNGRLPGPAVAMRAGWNQSQTHSASIFTRANDHPTDGAAVGMSDGLAAPPFPPALSTDATLYLHLWLEGTPDVAGIRRNADTNPVDVLEEFPDSLSGPLTVDGVAGTIYVSNVRFASMEGVVYDVLIAGAEIATVTDTTRYAATFGLLTDLAAATWTNYTSGLDAGELFKNGAFAVATAAGRDKLAVPADGVYEIKAMVVGIIDLGGSTDRAWLETRLVRTRGGAEVAQAPVGVLGYARNQLGTAAQTLTSAVDGFFELEANDEIHLEAMLSSQEVNNLLDLTSGYLGLVKF